ncbi:hypothetical protein [Streptomyces sp. NPDC089919]|uniref:hypothetical protein n=1 Tax=Streptomyces sp. NPDC089919 TaxID=3155188 RepID=UPI00342181A1
MPFEDDLGQALRRTGEGFGADQQALLDGGEVRGRRRLARRRLAVVTGGVLTVAVAATAGAWSDALFGGGSGGGVGKVGVSVATSPPVRGSGGDEQPRGGGKVSGEQMVATLKSLLPSGQWSETRGVGTRDVAASASGVFDDGHGPAAVGISLSRFDPKGRTARGMTECPSKVYVPHDACSTQKLPGGGRLMVFQGYEYPDKREDTKSWRATLTTPEGYLIDASEYNAPAEKGAQTSRTNPPLGPEQLKALVSSPRWRPALADLPAPQPENVDPGGGVGNIEGRFLSLLPKGLTVVEKGGDDGGGATFAVVDDGKGRTLVQINVQPRMGDVAGDLFTGDNVSTLPDGTKVKWEQKPGEKGGTGVVWWTVDTIRPDGLRVVVSAFNSGSQSSAATREAPALSIAQLRAIALSPTWVTG